MANGGRLKAASMAKAGVAWRGNGGVAKKLSWQAYQSQCESVTGSENSRNVNEKINLNGLWLCRSENPLMWLYQCENENEMTSSAISALSKCAKAIKIMAIEVINGANDNGISS